MKMLSGKKGFTLVEMLIVITIVGLLATISIGGYTRFRKVSVLDLSVDSITATIYDARDSAKFGKVVGDEVQCFGVRFVADGGSLGSEDGEEGVDVEDAVSGIVKFTKTFSNKKQWLSEKGRWIAGGCEGDDSSESPVNLGDLLKIEKVETAEGGDVSGGSCDVLFAPPGGEVFASDCVDVVIGYGDADDDLKRKISIDSSTGKVTIKPINEETTE